MSYDLTSFDQSRIQSGDGMETWRAIDAMRRALARLVQLQPRALNAEQQITNLLNNPLSSGGGGIGIPFFIGEGDDGPMGIPGPVGPTGLTVPAGIVLQMQSTETGAVATGTTTIPIDDTIPQITEGTEFMVLPITPTNAANKLRIDVVFVGSCNTASRDLCVALFQDATANALACADTSFLNNAANSIQVVKFSHYMTAGTTSATTFRVRAGVGTGGTVTFNGSGAARFFGGVLASSIIITEIAAPAGAYPYLLYQDQQTVGTNDGAFNSGSFVTRILNTEVSDVNNLGTLAANQITLAPGTYLCRASAPAWGVQFHQTRLQNVTDGTTLLTGTPMYTLFGAGSVGAVNRSEVVGVFTIAASKAIELQHRCSATKTVDGLGPACNFTTEIYATVELWKVA